MLGSTHHTTVCVCIQEDKRLYIFRMSKAKVPEDKMDDPAVSQKERTQHAISTGPSKHTGHGDSQPFHSPGDHCDKSHDTAADNPNQTGDFNSKLHHRHRNKDKEITHNDDFSSLSCQPVNSSRKQNKEYVVIPNTKTRSQAECGNSDEEDVDNLREGIASTKAVPQAECDNSDKEADNKLGVIDGTNAVPQPQNGCNYNDQCNNETDKQLQVTLKVEKSKDVVCQPTTNQETEEAKRDMTSTCRPFGEPRYSFHQTNNEEDKDEQDAASICKTTKKPKDIQTNSNEDCQEGRGMSPMKKCLRGSEHQLYQTNGNENNLDMSPLYKTDSENKLHQINDKNIDKEEEDPDMEPTSKTPAGKDIDQGWAWVVLVSCFLGMVIFGTFTFTVGVFQAEILHSMDPDVQTTSWVGASQMSTLCLIGPVAGMVRNKLGSRCTVLLSSSIVCLGMVAASFSATVTQIIVTYGVLTGIGTGMALNPMFVCVSFYFERYRAFASGIIAAGGGFGMFIGGPAIRQLIDTYGLRGTFLIWGAVGLNMAVVGMIMTPSSLEKKKEEEEEVVVGGGGVWRSDSALLASVSTLPGAAGPWGSGLALSGVMVKDRELDSLSQEQSQSLLAVPHLHDVIHNCNELSPDMTEPGTKPSWRAHNFLSSQQSLRGSIESPSVSRRHPSSHQGRRNVGKRSLNQSKDLLQREKARISKTRWYNLSSLEVVQILRHRGFVFYVLSGSIWVFGEAIVFTYLPTYAQDQGSSPLQSAVLITALGFTSTFSRVFVGFVAGNPAIGPDLMHIGMLGLCAMVTITLPLYAHTYSGQLAYAALYGMYSGGLASVINVLIISLIGVQHIALAFGLICFGQGIAALAGPPLSGAIVKAGGSYGDVFVFAGCLLLVACCLGFIMVLCKPQSSQEVGGDVDETGETTPAVKVRLQEEECSA